ncbi:MAG: hypothetical protein J3K34DRAFT_425493 [Monoraphidium minutum]|nr:MAG: hypothetical protein J3K34DRAFT_425493 [Monoraphidium minutum]
MKPDRRKWATELRMLLHLAAWCMMGVLARIEIGALFGGACATRSAAYGWAPCVTSPDSALVSDLPANMIGSFIMGMLTSSDVLSKHMGHTLSDPAALAMVPRTSSLQVHTAFQVGLRTGFCGSLTTFSSWMLQAVLLLVSGRGTDWVVGLLALLLNVLVCMSALVAGQHTALVVYHW